MKTETHTAIRPVRIARTLLPWLLLLLARSPAPAQTPSDQWKNLTENASAAREQGDIPRAIELYLQALQINPSWADGWWYVGSMQYATDSYGPAITSLTHFIDLTPNAGPALALRGLSEFELARYTDSLADLQHAISLGAANQPRNAGIIFYHEAILLTRKGDFEQALGKFTQIVNHGGTDPTVLVGIGLAGLRMPQLPSEIEPSQLDMVSAVGQAAAYFMSHDLPAADHAFHDLFDRYPTVANLHYFYGYLLFSTDPDKSIEQFHQELAVDPDSALTHSMLAWAYASGKDYSASLVQAQQAVKETPNLLIAQLVLGRALVETGSFNEGVEHLNAVVATDPQNLDAHLALAKAYSELGRKDDARRERLQCLAITAQGTKVDVAN